MSREVELADVPLDGNGQPENSLQVPHDSQRAVEGVRAIRHPDLRRLQSRFDDEEPYGDGADGDLYVLPPESNSKVMACLHATRDAFRECITKLGYTRLAALLGLMLVLAIAAALIATYKGNESGKPELAPPTGIVVKANRTDVDYLAITLANGMDVVLISDPNAEKAAASVGVRVGSSDDPKAKNYTYQGLAHFLEHMLFMGSEAYPGMSTFNEFMANYSGGHNAYTSEEETNYFFDIVPDKLEEGLDIMANFFVAPQLTQQAADQEILAVNAEHEKNLLADSWRYWQLLKSTSDEKSKLNHFGTGNLETLNQPGVRSALQKFFTDNYWADNMQAAVLGRQSIDQLKAMAERVLSQIPKRRENGQPIPSDLVKAPQGAENYATYLSTPLRFQRFRSVGSSNTLVLAWALNSQLDYYKVSPGDFITYLLGHEGEGTAANYLISRGLVSTFTAELGVLMKDIEVFNVELVLTEDGLGQIPLIVAVVEHYIRYFALQPESVLKALFEERLELLDTKFQFSDKSQPINYVAEITRRMAQRGRALGRDRDLASSATSLPRPAETVISSNLTDRYIDILNPPKLRDWKDSIVRNYLKSLSPDHLILTLMAPEPEPGSELAQRYPFLILNNETMQTESIYGTKYDNVDPGNPSSPITLEAKNMIMNAFRLDGPAVNPTLSEEIKWDPQPPQLNVFSPVASRMHLPSCSEALAPVIPPITDICGTLSVQTVIRDDTCLETSPRVARGHRIQVSGNVFADPNWLNGDVEGLSAAAFAVENWELVIPTTSAAPSVDRFPKNNMPDDEFIRKTALLHPLVTEALVGACQGDVISIRIPAKCTPEEFAHKPPEPNLDEDTVDVFDMTRFVIVRVDSIDTSTGVDGPSQRKVCPTTSTPVMIRNDNQALVWLAPDTELGLPRGHVGIEVVLESETPQETATPEEVALSMVRLRSMKFLWSHFVTAAASVPAYYAALAGSSITTASSARGFRLELNGYASTLARVLEGVVVSTWSNVDEVLNQKAFETGMNRALTALYQQRESLLYQQAFPLYNDIGTSLDGVTRDDMIQYLKTKSLTAQEGSSSGVTLNDLKQFMIETLSTRHARIELYAQGAFRPFDVTLYANQMLTALANIGRGLQTSTLPTSFWYIPQPSPVASASWVAPAPARLKNARVGTNHDKSPIIRFPTFNPADANSFTLNIYQYTLAPIKFTDTSGGFELPSSATVATAAARDDLTSKPLSSLLATPPARHVDLEVLKASTVAELIMLVFKDQAFKTLRTDEQLGYVASSGTVFSQGGVSSMYVLVQGSNPEHTADYYDTRIDVFVENFAQELADMTDGKFEELKTTLRTLKSQKPQTLATAFAQGWRQVTERTYIWHQRLYEAALMDTITKADAVAFYNKYLRANSESRKKLSMQMWRASALATAPDPSVSDGLVVYTGPLTFQNVKEHVHNVLGFYDNTPIYPSVAESYWNNGYM